MGADVAALPPPNEKLEPTEDEVWPKAGLATALPNKLVDALEVVEVEVVVLPKAGGAVVGAELGAFDDVAPNPPNVGVAAEVVIVVAAAMDPKEGVVEVLVEEPKAGTAEFVPAVAPNVGGAADAVPNANGVDPVPKAGAAEDVVTGVAGVGATTAALAAPPNENALPAVVGAVVATVLAAEPAPKLKPPDEGGGAELAAVVAGVTVPKAGGAVDAVATVEGTAGLNALKPLAPPPKVIVLACVTVVAVVAAVAVAAVVPNEKPVVSVLDGLLVASVGAGEKLIRFGVEAGFGAL